MSKISSIKGKHVYTTVGKYVGTVKDVLFDTNETKISHIEVKTKKKIKGKNIVDIPYEWVTAMADIVLIQVHE